MSTPISILPSPFAGTAPPRERNWLERLLRLSRPQLAEQAIAALFAAESPLTVGESRITDILQRYRALGHRAREVAGRIWSRALESFLADNALSDHELKYLDRLSRLLDVGYDDVESINAQLIHPRYQKAVADAVRDGVLSKEEREFLATLQAGLRLPQDLATKLSEGPKEKAAIARLSELVADRRLSPDEFKSIAQVETDLDLKFDSDPRVEAGFARYAELWRIENGQMPVVEAAIALQKSETCHFAALCEWWELRTRTTRVDYMGPTGSIRIAKGLRFRIGSIAPQRVTTDELTLIDEGTVYFTNKRVIFDGAKKNTAIRHSALIGMQAFSDALALEKATGRSPYLFIKDTDMERAAVILSTLIAGD